MNTINKLLPALDSVITHITPVEWNESKRVLTKEVSDYPGPVSYRLTPYLIKPTNFFMADRLAQISTIMKGSQLGISSILQYGVMGWIMAESQANTLFITENDDKIRDQMQGPINQMINCSGLDKIIGNHNIREREAKGRRQSGTGDTQKGITFPNGRLHTWSGQVISSLSSWPIKYGLYDEVERWKGSYKSAGAFIDLVEPRHKSYGDRRKLMFSSTPEIQQTSNIEPLYLLGDQQKYMIPCPKCGELIELVWHQDVDGESAGIYYDRDNKGRFIENSAMYICQKCGGTFKESHKWDMYEEAYSAYQNKTKPAADWVPTAEPESYIYESYHISSIYAPSGFYSWNHMARTWCSIHPKGQKPKKDKLQTFYNQELGLTWVEKGKSNEINQLLKNTRNYEINTLPNGLSIQDGNGKIVLVTVAVDLNGKEDDARLDYEVRAWSMSGSSYSIDHGSIGTFQRSKAMRSGKAKSHEQKEQDRVKWTYRMNYENNVWTEFEKTVMGRKYLKDDGTGQLVAAIYGIDTGHFTVHSMQFVAKHALCVAIKGKVENKYTKYDSIKAFYTVSAKVPGLHLVEGDRVKDYVADNISLVWSEEMDMDQPPGFMNFPNPKDGKYLAKTYFSDYEGEERMQELNENATAIGWKWDKKHSSSSNHYWDIACYNAVSRDIIVDKFCKLAKVPAGWANFVNLVKNI